MITRPGKLGASMPSAATLSAVLYARISSDRNGNEVGVATQLTECRRFALGLGVAGARVVEVTDNDTSVFRRGSRKGWTEVRDLIASRRVQHLVVWHLDRMFRHPTDLEDLLDLVEAHKVVVHSVTAGDLRLSTNEGKLAARIMVNVARYEVDHKSSRQALRHKAIAEAGEWSGGKRPLGFRRIGPRTLDIDPKESVVLREAASKILRGGSLAAASRWVSAELGRHVAPRTLRGALTKPTIAGLREYFPQKEREAWAARRQAGEVRGDFPEELRYTPAKWPAVLDEDTWKALRALLLHTDRRASQARPSDSLLRGVLRCCGPMSVDAGGTADGICGRRLGYSRSSYKCMAGVGGCGKVGISTTAIERLVCEWAEAAVEEAVGTQGVEIIDADVSVDVGELEARRDQVGSRIEEQLQLHSEGLVAMSHLKSTLEKLYRQLDEAGAAVEEARASEIRREQRARVLRIANWESADIDARRTIIRELFVHIDIYPRGRDSGSRFDESRVHPVWRA